MDKSQYSTGFGWLVGLVLLFSLGLLYIIFNQALSENFVPVIIDIIPNSSLAKNQVVIDTNEWMSYWNFVPFLLLFVILTFWLISSLRKNNP